MQKLRDHSGRVDDSRLLVAFLYRALRDGHLVPGVAEQIVMDIAASPVADFQFTNGWLANYAIDLADRLTP